MNRRLHGSCQVPVAGYATLEGERLHLQALVGDARNGEVVRAQAEGTDPQALGSLVAGQLLAAGGDVLLSRLARP